jgi:hypothetical protein
MVEQDTPCKGCLICLLVPLQTLQGEDLRLLKTHLIPLLVGQRANLLNIAP